MLQARGASTTQETFTAPLSGAERARLRGLIDKARREQLASTERRDSGGRKRCTGCGGVLYEYTRDCRRCTDRRGSRARRANAQTGGA